MTQPCNMEPGHGLGLDAYRGEDAAVREQRAQDAFGLEGYFDDGAPPEPVTPSRPHRPEPLDPKLADMAHRLRHDAGDLRERACRLPYGARRHRLFKAAVEADCAALEIEAWPEAAEIDALYPAAPRHPRHG